ncbi:hypothetical protein SAMN04489834_3145 [Microterricola viridarii]|uniref:Uncharacterized protein n=1 Tax=Microterricola viridarii TaxID=412690 RepID=A0A1H1YN55_9MICO|nr:hypothetical protein SAMN04489834_3145 [Microterricola viridarii]
MSVQAASVAAAPPRVLRHHQEPARPFPKPIRYDADTWLVMRTDPVLPKAVIQRVHGADGDRYLLLRWGLDPAKRVLRGVHDSLQKPNELVLYDVPEGAKPRAAAAGRRRVRQTGPTSSGPSPLSGATLQSSKPVGLVSRVIAHPEGARAELASTDPPGAARNVARPS